MFLPRHTTRATAASALSVLSGLIIFAGCNKNTAAPGTGRVVSTSGLAAGQQIFQTNGCARCHTVNGQGGRRGPDLSHIGTGSKHTPQWLESYVKNPQQIDSGSRMPAFGDRIKDDDLMTLGAYLASLK